MLRPINYAYQVQDVDNILDTKGNSWTITHAKFKGTYGGNPVAIFVSTRGNHDVVKNLAIEEQLEMRLKYDQYSNPQRQEFDNVLVVCAELSDCQNISELIIENARIRRTDPTVK